MIEIDPATVAAHPLMARLSNPPTHARLVERVIRLGLGDDMIKVTYRFGTLDANGAFVPDDYVKPVHALVDLSDYSNGLANVGEAWLQWAQQKAAAAAYLRAADVAPDPTKPFEAISMPGAIADDFKVCDIDAYFGYFDERLKGTVVSDEPATTATAPAPAGQVTSPAADGVA